MKSVFREIDLSFLLIKIVCRALRYKGLNPFSDTVNRTTYSILYCIIKNQPSDLDGGRDPIQSWDYSIEWVQYICTVSESGPVRIQMVFI